MCDCQVRANNLLAAYRDVLFYASPAEYQTAITVIHALRQVTGASRGELQACALPHTEQAEDVCRT